MSNEIKFDISGKNHKYNLYRQFIAWNCNGCLVDPLKNYVNYEIYQEFPTKKDYFTNSEEKMYLDLRKSKSHIGELEQLTRDDSDLTLKTELKAASTKK